MKPKPLVLAVISLSLFLPDLVSAARFNVHGEPRSRRFGGTHARRANIFGTTSVSDQGDMDYNTVITLGGQNFTVVVDTGSSDLWVAGTVPDAKNTGKAAKIPYAVETLEGQIFTAPLEFAGYTVSDQAYLSIDASSDHPDGTGIIGLGPNYGSQVSNAIGDQSGDTPLDRIFLQNASTPNFITFLLGRINDPTDSPTGDLTVGEILPGFEEITSQPKLPVSVLASSDSVNQHWQILLDSDGIVGPAGEDIIKNHGIKTAIASTPDQRQLTVVIDTGFSLPQVPPEVATAIYKDVPGAQLVNREDLNGEVWQIPCDKEINITFKFAGKSFPIHPLDTNMVTPITDANGNPLCVGAFQPSIVKDAPFDAIFGMAFLRNAYIYINFGDFVEGSTAKTSDPYVQMLSTTNDTAEAHSDFLNVRGDSPWTPQTSFADKVRSHLPLVIGLSVGAGVLLIVAIIACALIGRRRQRYQPLRDPAPEAYIMSAVGQGGNTLPSKQGGSKRYSNPWDAR